MRTKYVLLYGDKTSDTGAYSEHWNMPIEDTFTSPAKGYFESDQYQRDKDLEETAWDRLEIHDLTNFKTNVHLR